MQDQHYRLVETWCTDEWPLAIDTETIETLNEISSPFYHYSIYASNENGTRVELLEYVGEYEEITDASED